MTNTSNLDLERPDKGDANWHTSLNSNFTKLDTGYGNNVATIADLPEVYIRTDTFNSTSGVTITLPNSVDAVNEYNVTITPTTRGAAIGDIYVTKTTSNFVVYCSEANTSDTFAAVIYYIGDVNSYGGSIYRRWYVSTDASITDHSDNTDTGSLAWVLAQISSNPATVELPGNKTYIVSANDITINDNIVLIPQKGAILTDDSNNADLTINGSLIVGYGQQIFDWGNGTGSVVFGSGFMNAVYPEWWGVDGTNDEIQFEAAAAAAVNIKTIKTLCSTYAIDDDLTIPSGILLETANGASYTIANTKTLTINGKFKAYNHTVFSGSGSVSFTTDTVSDCYIGWWGADRDGWQAVINLAASAGCDIWFPEGTYDFSSDDALSIPAGSVIKLHDAAVMTRSSDVNKALFEFGGNHSSLRGGQYSYTAGTTGISISHCAIDTNDYDHLTIKDIYVSGKFYIGVIIDNSVDVKIDGCTVRGVVNRGIYPYQICEEIHINNCTVDGYNVGGTTETTSYGFNLNPASQGTMKSVILTNCIAKNCINQGFEFGDSLLQCMAIACTAKNIVSGYGFLIQTANGTAADYVILSGCNSVSSQIGYYITESDYASLHGCIATSNTTYGFQLNEAQGCTLTGCISNGNTNDGFYLNSNSNRNIITGCQGVSNGAYGLNIANANCNLTYYTGNFFYNNTSGEVNDSGTDSSGSNNGTT